MNFTKQNLYTQFNGSTIYRVPFFQRNYVWGEENWSRFLTDMEYVSASKKDYFLGTIILKQIPTNVGSEECIIVDGQQRLTTLAIFYKVLCILNKSEYAFLNGHVMRVKDHSKPTIEHSMYDKGDFNTVMNWQENKAIADKSPSKIIQAFDYFLSHVNIEKINSEIISNKVFFMQITLHHDEDEQVIFDTINSLGVKLTTGELLKNYFFSEADIENYKKKWLPVFEVDNDAIDFWNADVVSGRNKHTNMDVFFNAFFGIKTQDKRIGITYEARQRYRKYEGIFTNYKDFIEKYEVDKSVIVDEIAEYAKIYRKCFDTDITQKDLPANGCLERMVLIIKELDCTTAIPYVLFVMKNVDDRDERNRIFGYLESYIVRRIICKCNNNSFSDLFTEKLIGNDIRTAKELMSKLTETNDSTELAMPNNQHLLDCMSIVKFTSRKRAKAILYLMESKLRDNNKRATKLHVYDAYSLEHLMPIKWSRNWPLSGKYDEESRNNLIGTLGNMTLLPSKLNTSVSNSSWSDKKNGKNGKGGLNEYAADLVTLRKYLKLDVWDEKEILARSSSLANKANEIWPSSIAENKNVESATAGDNVKKETEGKKQRLTTQDKTKFRLNNSEFMPKAEFVRYFVREYVKKYPKKTYEELRTVFNDGLCASGYIFQGMLLRKEQYDSLDNEYKDKRYSPRLSELRSANGVVFYVNSQWTLESINNFIPLAKKEGWTIESDSKHIFYLKARGCDARGYYDMKKFVVIKGSVIANKCTSSYNPKGRDEFIEKYVEMQDGKLVLVSDAEFDTPSKAAGFCNGRSTNGWADWKDSDGNSLDSVYRKGIENVKTE